MDPRDVAQIKQDLARILEILTKPPADWKADMLKQVADLHVTMEGIEASAIFNHDAVYIPLESAMGQVMTRLIQSTRIILRRQKWSGQECYWISHTEYNEWMQEMHRIFD